jgi:hypothetical protein
VALTFQQKLTLEDGSAVLYHEGNLQSGEKFHILILVPGKNIESYFHYIATKADFAVRTLEAYGRILHCDTGSLNETEMDNYLKAIIT